MNFRLKQRLKSAAKGFAASGGNPYVAGGAFLAPGLTGDSSNGFFGEKGATGGPDKSVSEYLTENKGQINKPGDGAGGVPGGGQLSDVRARIEELRRQQYDARTANLEKVMGFFGPVNQELKSIYGVDMPTWSGGGPAPGGGAAAPAPSRFTNNYSLKEPFNAFGPLPKTAPDLQLGAFDILPKSPFATPPQVKPGFQVSRLKNPKSSMPEPAPGQTGRLPQQIAGDWKTKVSR